MWAEERLWLSLKRYICKINSNTLYVSLTKDALLYNKDRDANTLRLFYFKLKTKSR